MLQYSSHPTWINSVKTSGNQRKGIQIEYQKTSFEPRNWQTFIFKLYETVNVIFVRNSTPRFQESQFYVECLVCATNKGVRILWAVRFWGISKSKILSVLFLKLRNYYLFGPGISIKRLILEWTDETIPAEMRPSHPSVKNASVQEILKGLFTT